jgi:hypothetical protein
MSCSARNPNPKILQPGSKSKKIHEAKSEMIRTLSKTVEMNSTLLAGKFKERDKLLVQNLILENQIVSNQDIFRQLKSKTVDKKSKSFSIKTRYPGITAKKDYLKSKNENVL